MKPIILLITLLLSTQPTFADTIYLKNGNVVEGEISEQSDDTITVRETFGSGRITSTYRMSDIERIEESSMKKQASKQESKKKLSKKENPVKKASYASGLDVSLEQAMWGMTQYFKKIEEGIPVKGVPRRLCETIDGQVLYEMIGEKDNLVKINIAIATPSDYSNIERRDAILKNLGENAVREWPGFYDWVAKVIREEKMDTITQGDKVITVEFRKDMNLSVVTVRKKDLE
ncbi:MAG: hypothetical protein ABIJ27_00050 [Candidatus Omnitrophota bacterium]